MYDFWGLAQPIAPADRAYQHLLAKLLELRRHSALRARAVALAIFQELKAKDVRCTALKQAAYDFLWTEVMCE